MEARPAPRRCTARTRTAQGHRTHRRGAALRRQPAPRAGSDPQSPHVTQRTARWAEEQSPAGRQPRALSHPGGACRGCALCTARPALPPPQPQGLARRGVQGRVAPPRPSPALPPRSWTGTRASPGPSAPPGARSVHTRRQQGPKKPVLLAGTKGARGQPRAKGQAAGCPQRQQAGGLQVTPPRAEARQNTHPARGVESELGGGQRAARRQALAGEGAPPTGKQRGRRTTATRGPHRFLLRTASQTRDKSPREGRCVASAPGDVHRTRGRPRPDASLPRADAGLEGSRAGPKKLKKTKQAGTPPSHAPHSHPTQPSSPRKQSW